jgi:hypothetical protein
LVSFFPGKSDRANKGDAFDASAFKNCVGEYF